MILTLLTMIGVVLVALSTVPYIRAVLGGRARPRLVSWGIWTVLAAIMTVAGLQEGQLQSALLTGVTAAACGTILLLGWRHGSRAMARIDMICLVGAVAGVAAFLVVGDTTMALVISVVVDAVAFIPTLVHGWTNPEEESLTSFAMATAGELLVIAAAILSGATVAGLLYPAYAIVFNGGMTLLLAIGNRSRIGESYEYGTDEV